MLRCLIFRFVFYSSNGDGFAEHDFLTGKERQGLDEFPTEVELVARFKQESGMTPRCRKL